MDADTLLKTLDVPIEQVAIEAKLVTIKEQSAQDLGIRWGYSSSA